MKNKHYTRPEIESEMKMIALFVNIFVIIFRLVIIRPIGVSTGFLSSAVVEKMNPGYIILFIILIAASYICAERPAKIDSASYTTMTFGDYMKMLIKYDMVSFLPLCGVMGMILYVLNNSGELFLFIIDVIVDAVIFYVIAVIIKIVWFNIPLSIMAPRTTDKYKKDLELTQSERTAKHQ